MNLEDYFDCLSPDDIRVKGTRVGIETVLYEYIYREQTPERIVQSFPSITLEQVYATILYYLHNKTAVEAYLADWLAFGQQQRAEQSKNPHPVILRLRQLKARQQHVHV